MNYDPELKHRRSIRLQGYDYADAGGYFVTICTQGRESLFGRVIDGKMHLNDAGRMVEQLWSSLPVRFPTVTLDVFIVMPNHFHGIVLLTDCDIRRGESCIRPNPDEPCITHENDLRPEPAHKEQGDHKDRPYGTTKDSLGRIIQGFKSLTTNAYIRGVNENGWQPFSGKLWQRNYYEQIIRNEAELTAIREYSAANPSNWDEDHENIP